MRYHDIQRVSMVDGEGIRTVLWVSGCNHHCPGCQNPVTWNPDDGLLFDDNAVAEIMEDLDHDWCDGLTLSGGDPMFTDNRETVTELCRKIRERFGDSKTIWMYTGYLFHELGAEPILKYIDVIVDGEFIKAEKDIHYMWAGSTNQRIWRKKDGFWHLMDREWEQNISTEVKYER